MELEDVEAEFLYGMLKNLKLVRSDIGNPIAHLIQRGVWQVKSVLREELNRRIVQQCLNCGNLNDKYRYSRKCDSCSGDVENVYRYEPDDVINESRGYTDDVASLTVDDIRSRASERHQRIIDAIISAIDIDPLHPFVVAARLLKISRQRVHQHVVRIRKDMGYLTR